VQPIELIHSCPYGGLIAKTLSVRIDVSNETPGKHQTHRSTEWVEKIPSDVKKRPQRERIRSDLPLATRLFQLYDSIETDTNSEPGRDYIRALANRLASYRYVPGDIAIAEALLKRHGF
jgi:hypothetical protein